MHIIHTSIYTLLSSAALKGPEFTFHTEGGEEDGGGDEEAEHQPDHDDAGHHRTETPPAHHQEDPAHHADQRRQGQADCGEERVKTSSNSAHCAFNHANRQEAFQLTVVVQVCGPCDQHEEEKGCEAESHAKQLCAMEREGVQTSDIRVIQSGLRWRDRSRQTSLMLRIIQLPDEGGSTCCRIKTPQRETRCIIL